MNWALVPVVSFFLAAGSGAAAQESVPMPTKAAINDAKIDYTDIAALSRDWHAAKDTRNIRAEEELDRSLIAWLEQERMELPAVPPDPDMEHPVVSRTRYVIGELLNVQQYFDTGKANVEWYRYKSEMLIELRRLTWENIRREKRIYKQMKREAKQAAK